MFDLIDDGPRELHHCSGCEHARVFPSFLQCLVQKTFRLQVEISDDPVWESLSRLSSLPAPGRTGFGVAHVASFLRMRQSVAIKR
jgi:hypothetical protein